jgi:hypothetical protein
MRKLTKQLQSNAEISAMETETISKNEASPKSRKTSRINIFKLLFCLAVIGVIASCTRTADEEEDIIDPLDPFFGTWVHDASNGALTVIVDDDFWTAELSNVLYNSGIYYFEDDSAFFEITDQGKSSAKVGETGKGEIINNKFSVSGFSDPKMNGTYSKKK